MKTWGSAKVADFLEDFVVYRRLEPADSRLPGLASLAEQLGLSAKVCPRKSDRGYARVIARILDSANSLQGDVLRHFVYIGDSPLDAKAFLNLRDETDWAGLAFIGKDSAGEPPELRLEDDVCRSNRWTGLEAFVGWVQERGIHLDASCAMVVDLDKTLLGPRGRNDRAIDAARSQAALEVARNVLGNSEGEAEFRTIYGEMSQPGYHFFTEDNQDYLVYCALMLASGAYRFAELKRDFAEQRVARFSDFVEIMDREIARASCSDLLAIHQEVVENFTAGDPTPFKSFRRQEYLTTTSRMGSDPGNMDMATLLRDRITLNFEVVQVLDFARNKGVSVLGLSDKPDEAVYPTDSLAAQGHRPLHHVETLLVGENLNLK